MILQMSLSSPDEKEMLFRLDIYSLTINFIKIDNE